MRSLSVRYVASRSKNAGLKVLSGVRAGGFCVQCGGNHSRTLQRVGKPRIDPLKREAVRKWFADNGASELLKEAEAVRRRALRAIKAADAVVAMRRAQVAQ